jgi:hypothetical protein
MSRLRISKGICGAIAVLAIGLSASLSPVVAWTSLSSGGITASEADHWLSPTAPDPTGAWTGPPEFEDPDGDPSGVVGQPHGGMIYFWKLRGIKGALPASANTMVLVTDDWRWRSSYRRVDDTIELTATDGRRFRRKATPEFGVVAVISPDVDTQATSPTNTLVGALRLPNGTTVSLEVSDSSWIAERVQITDVTGADSEIAGVPKYPSSSIGRRWQGAPGPNADVTDESIVAEGTFAITVPGFSEDLTARSIFEYPLAPQTPDISIKVLGGIASLRDLTVSFGVNSGITRNGFYLLTQPAGPGVEIPIPPETPNPVAIRFAILYVPGDSTYIAEEVADSPWGK